jgi:hypothetical protein
MRGAVCRPVTTTTTATTTNTTTVSATDAAFATRLVNRIDTHERVRELAALGVHSEVLWVMQHGTVPDSATRRNTA